MGEALQTTQHQTGGEKYGATWCAACGLILTTVRGAAMAASTPCRPND